MACLSTSRSPLSRSPFSEGFTTTTAEPRDAGIFRRMSLVAAHGHLLDGLQAHLGETQGLRATDVRSLYRRMQDDVHLTISRVLQA
jgi:hypothetical protein